MSTQPSNVVSIKMLANERGDLTNCEITIGDKVIVAPFEDACLTLEYRLWEEFGDELTDAVVKAVTNVSKQQMLAEAERLKSALVPMAIGTIAIMDGDKSIWLDEQGELACDQCLWIGEDQPDPIKMHEIAYTSAHAFWQLAEAIRNWLVEPVTKQADPQWLMNSPATKPLLRL